VATNKADAPPDQPEQLGPFLVETPRQLEVLRIIRDHGVVTRADIANILQASASQVSRLTAPLIARDLVTVEPRLPYAEGRPTELLTLTHDTHYVVGVDVGGLAQDAVITNLRGDIVGSASSSGVPADSRSSIVTQLGHLIDRSLADADVPPSQILGVGIGVRAIIDPISGVISAGPETPRWSPLWVGFDLRAELAGILPWNRLAIDDTVRALAAAEQCYGTARGVGDFVYLLADSGIGAALMFDGHPYIGPGHLAGEVGHIVLDRDGPLCGCGRRGCVEMYASTSAMLAQAQVIDPAISSIDDAMARAILGDPACRQILSAAGAALGRAIGILLNLLSPALVVIGGRATESAIYMESARESARIDSLEQPFRTAQIVTSRIHANSGAQGAATLILNELFGSAPAIASSSTSGKQAIQVGT
jgi:predicted NBD/HSP70 family sugar kinase